MPSSNQPCRSRAVSDSACDRGSGARFPGHIGHSGYELGRTHMNTLRMVRRAPDAVVAIAAVILAVLVVAIERSSAQSDLPTAKAESVGMSTPRLARIHDYIQGYMDR